MTHSEFKRNWLELEDNLRPITQDTLDSLNLTEAAKVFLNSAGLPDSAAPFLSFVGDIQTNEKYDSINYLTSWFDFLEDNYKKYIVIGGDGCGDIIALNSEKECQVEWLDHEDYFSSRFMNSSIGQLANSLLVYREFIRTINKENGEDAYLETKFSNAQFDNLNDILKTIDERAVGEGFWKSELDTLLANRADSFKNP